MHRALTMFSTRVARLLLAMALVCAPLGAAVHSFEHLCGTDSAHHDAADQADDLAHVDHARGTCVECLAFAAGDTPAPGFAAVLVAAVAIAVPAVSPASSLIDARAPRVVARGPPFSLG